MEDGRRSWGGFALRRCVGASVLLVLLMVALAGCGSRTTESSASPGTDASPTAVASSSTALPADATAGQVVTAALRWIEAADCMATKLDLTAPVHAWFYRQGGEAAVGYGGEMVISGDRLLVAVNGQFDLLSTPAESEDPSAPRYWEISAADFPDRASVQAAERVIAVWWGLLSDPYHAIKLMRPEAGVERNTDGSTFTVRGVVRSDDLCRPYLGAATDWAMELEYIVRIEIPVTLTVDSWGRPLETNVAYFGDLTTARRFGWVRGVWEVDGSQVMGVSDYLESLESE